MVWLLLAVACGSAFLGYLAGARLPWVDDMFDSLGEAEDALSSASVELDRALERADEAAEIVRDLLFPLHGRDSVEQAVLWLAAHDGARGHR